LANLIKFPTLGERLWQKKSSVRHSSAIYTNNRILQVVCGARIHPHDTTVQIMRDDWMLVPEALHIACRTMRVVETNLAFATLYNLVGLALGAFGFLPPMLAAAAQSLADLGILGDSVPILHQETLPWRLRRFPHH
jgi:hypothetical protein